MRDSLARSSNLLLPMAPALFLCARLATLHVSKHESNQLPRTLCAYRLSFVVQVTLLLQCRGCLPLGAVVVQAAVQGSEGHVQARLWLRAAGASKGSSGCRHQLPALGMPEFHLCNGAWRLGKAVSLQTFERASPPRLHLGRLWVFSVSSASQAAALMFVHRALHLLPSQAAWPLL